jgi:CRISPR-associated protein Csb2
LLQLDAGGFRPFDTARSAVTVAGMMRHAARSAAERAGWPQARIDTFILGHGEPREATPHVPVGPGRYAYVPLPSIEARGTRAGHASSRSAGNDSGGYGQAEEAAIVGQVVGSVRRGLLTAFGEGCEEEIAWARRALSGQELFDEESHNPVALLALLPSDDRTVMRYTRAATTWATVTPMILPGYDDRAHLRRRLKSAEDEARQRQLLERLESRIDQLLRKAIVQAGYAPVLAAHAALEWRRVGFWPGTEPVDRYRVPGHLKQLPRLHVTIQWRDAQDRPVHIRGPICLGSGRFYGMGLFAALDR